VKPSRLLPLAAAALLGGCAAMINGTYDTITINSLEPGTKIFVDGVPRGLDTATLQVRRGDPHVIRAEKPGCDPLVMETGEAFDSLSLLGVFIDFGLFSIPIDLISGAAWKTQPLMYTVTPMSRAVADRAAPPATGVMELAGFAPPPKP
jgi:hypothetical protein